MSARLIIYSIVLLLASAACTSWHTQSLSPAQVIAEKHPDQMRVILADSSKMVMRNPAISRNRLEGVAAYAPRSIALADVARVELRGFSIWRTLGLIQLIGLVATAAGGGPGGPSY